LKKSLDLNLNMKSIEILKIKIEISSNINFWYIKFDSCLKLKNLQIWKLFK
jgi:hypothetical protein